MYGLAFTIWFGSAIVMRSGWIVIRASRSKGTGPVDRRARIPSGPDIEGVIGTAKVFQDVWGDTVNTASRMEFHGGARAHSGHGSLACAAAGAFRVQPSWPR